MINRYADSNVSGNRPGSRNVSQISNEASAIMSRVSERAEPNTDFNSKAEITADQDSKEVEPAY